MCDRCGISEGLCKGTTRAEVDGYKVEPIRDLRNGRTVGCELLYCGTPLQTTGQWREWYQRIPEILASLQPVSGWIAVNIDTWQILDNVMLDFLQCLCSDNLVIEWTESSLGQPRGTDILEAAHRLLDLRERSGTRISIDDAGAGIDAIHRMSLARPDFVKIDGTLFHRARGNRHTRTLIQGLVSTVHAIGAQTIIEWIETSVDYDLAQSLNAMLGQGFLFCREDRARDNGDRDRQSFPDRLDNHRKILY